MMSKWAYKSDAFEAVHTSAKALRKVGAIDKATMRDFDVACLSVTAGPPIPPVKVNKGFIVKIRQVPVPQGFLAFGEVTN